jgi:hypothetical protein
VPLFAKHKYTTLLDILMDERVTIYFDNDLIVFDSVEGVCAWRFTYHQFSDGSDHLFLYKGVSCIYSACETQITKFLKEQYLLHINNQANLSIERWLS